MTIPRISFSNIVSLLFSLAIALPLLYYGHAGLEQELARPNRIWYVEAFYGVMMVIGLLVAPSVRDRIVPAVATGLKLVRDGRRVTDNKFVATVTTDPAIPEAEIPPPAVKP